MGFEESFNRVFAHEGGLTKDARDPGNWTGGNINKGELRGTKFGISAAAYPTLDIENLTADQAMAIYKRDYWDRVGMETWPPELQFQFFDTAVNSGVYMATRLLQLALGVRADGVLGPDTKFAIIRADAHGLTLRFIAERLEFMTKSSAWPTFSRGWAVRIAQNLRYAAVDYGSTK